MTKPTSEAHISDPTDNRPSQLEAYSVDGMVPKRLFSPMDLEEAGQILTLSSREKAAVVPWGNGTKMDWGNIPSRLDWVVSTGRLDRIRDCDYENLTITTESGIPLSTIQSHLRGLGRGYFVPLDPPFSQTATMGGIVATDSSGPKRHLYGTARDLVLGMKVLLPGGKLNRWGGQTVKNVAGYDMSKLYIGSFGTLGLIGEITFRLLPLPERETTWVALFREIPTAFESVARILQSELLPSAVDISNARAMELLGLELPPADAKTLLAVSFEGFSESVERQVRQVETMAQPFHPLAAQVLEGVQQEKLWRGLRDLGSLLHPRFPDRISCRISVPISRTGEVFALWDGQKNLDLGLRSHAGSGIVNVDILPRDITLEAGILVQTLREMRRSIQDLEGIMTLLRVPLALKKQVDVWGVPDKSFAIMESLKSRLDPDRRFNPGRFVGGI